MRIDGFVAREQKRSHTQIQNLCGVLVHAWPESRHQVAQALAALPGVEVHRVADDGRLIVTVEDAPGDGPNGTWAGATIDRFNSVQGVLSVALVYHHFEPEQEGEFVP